MYQYQSQRTTYSSRRRPQKRKLRNILIPVGVVLCVILLVVNIVDMLLNNSTPAEPSLVPITQDYLATFTVEEGRVDVLFGREENAAQHTATTGNLINLNTNEGIQTAANTRITLKLVNNDIIRVDRDTRLFLEETRDKNIAIHLEEGSLWIVSDPNKTTYPTLLTKIAHANVFISRGSSASITRSDTEEYISVQGGSVQTEVLAPNGTILRTFPVGVGQEITLTEQTVNAATTDTTVDFVQAQSSTFKESDWYQWNTNHNTSLSDFESGGTEDFFEAERESTTPMEPTSEVSRSEFTVTSHFTGQTVAEEYITLAGDYNPSVISNILIDGKEVMIDNTTGKWKKNHRLTKEGSNTATITGQKNGEKVTLATLTLTKDTVAPAAPVITSPSRETSHTTTQNAFTLSGTTTTDAAKIIVNDYTLQKFSPGDTRWAYNVSAAIGNLKAGSNTFEVYAVDKAGNKSPSASITITYQAATTQDTDSTSTTTTDTSTETTNTATDTTESSEAAEEDTTSDTTETTPPVTSLTAPVVTFPVNKNSTTAEPEVTIRGTVSSATRRVTVNGYALQQYSPGSTSFLYNAFVRLGTLRAGSNTYTVIAYDAAGKASPATTITINYQPVQ